MPRPRSLFRQHLPQLHLCSEPLRHMLIGGHTTRFFFFFFLHFLIPPYVSTAHMTSLPSHLLHPDTITHFFCLFFFFPFPFSDWENGKGRGGVHTAFLLLHTHEKKKTLDQQAAPTLMTSHYAEIDTHFAFFLSEPSLFFFFSWTVDVDPADILNYCGMLREAQVPGNLTPTALPSA